MLVILGFLAGGVAFAALGTTAGFFIMYGICWAISWVAGSDDYMFFMWAGIVILPVIAIACFVGGGAIVAMVVGGCSGKREPGGSEVAAQDAADGAG